MRKMGTFRGIPVYMLQYSLEYPMIDSNKEELYVVNGRVYYHGIAIGEVSGNQLVNFDEDQFNELRRKGWYKDDADLLGKVTNTAETRPQEEKKPDYEVPETGCGNDIIEQFMASWRDNIDGEIAKLQVTMEAEICAANKI